MPRERLSGWTSPPVAFMAAKGIWMPTKPARMCRIPNCPNLTQDPSGYCPLHKPAYSVRKPDKRMAPSRRGYCRAWRKVREEVLERYGIPRHLWSRYDVDHNPPYNPAVEPDHRKYTLIPRLHAEHSSKTCHKDGGFGHARRGESESYGSPEVYRSGYPSFHTTDSRGKGVGDA
jgi:5-methylcytosine-specific restriction protein A